MTVFGVDAIEALGNGRLELARGDHITPLARERAKELGIEVRERTDTSSVPPAKRTERASRPSSTAIPRIDLGQPASLPYPPAPALFRRGAPFPGLLGRNIQPTASGSPRVARVTIIGAGNVGTHAAMRLAETDLVDEIVLVDLVEGLARGVALDLTHASGLLGFGTRVRGEGSVEAAGPSDYTILTAGRPRTPGMSRTDLTTTNAAVVAPLATTVGRMSPNGVLVVVTNPLDEMTELAWKSSGLPAERVIGMAGLLDSARFQALAGLASDARADQVTGVALGSHGDEMVVPRSQTRIGQYPADEILGTTLDAVIDRTRDSGAEVVGLLGKGSAFITPGLAAARMVESMLRKDKRLISATVRPSGQYGLRDVYVGLPVRLGPNGVSEVVELPLTADERSSLHAAAREISSRVASMPNTTRVSAS